MEVGTKMGAMIDFGWSSGSGVYFGWYGSTTTGGMFQHNTPSGVAIKST